jgi:hypothetical protein
MTPKQMHIEVRQGLQQVASNKTFKFLDEELDLILNKMTNRLIKLQLSQKTDPRGKPTGGFEVSQIGADMIRPLIVSSYSMVPYVKDGRLYQCFLPPDYSFLLSDWSYTKLICDEDPAPVVTTDSLYLTALRQDISTAAASPYYVASFKTTLGGRSVEIPADLMADNNWIGLVKKDQVYELTQFIANKGQWYWELFGGQNMPGYYINVSTNSGQTIGAQSTIDGAVNQNIKQQVMTLDSHRTNENTKYYDNRLMASDNISGLNSTEFYKSSYYSPISELAQGILYIYRGTNFIVSEVGISYIRKANPISISLNTKCELPEEFHSTVCDLAVEYIKGRLENYQSWQQTTADNDKRVII